MFDNFTSGAMKKRSHIAGAMAGLLFFVAGCSAIDADIGYDPDVPVSLIEEDAAPIRIGQFTDRRGQKAHLLGKVSGTTSSLGSGLEADRPVTEIVRDVMTQAAYDRGMLSEGGDQTRYQLYGQITRLEGVEGSPSMAHANLVARLFDLKENRDVYVTNHQVEHTASPASGYSFDLGKTIEEALNQVVALSLDDPGLRTFLNTEGQES